MNILELCELEHTWLVENSGNNILRCLDSDGHYITLYANNGRIAIEYENSRYNAVVYPIGAITYTIDDRYTSLHEYLAFKRQLLRS